MFRGDTSTSIVSGTVSAGMPSGPSVLSGKRLWGRSRGTGLAPLNPGVMPWEALGSDVRRLCERLQETYAAFLDHTNSEIGRLIDQLKWLGCLDNTVVVLLSDNGASAEGGPTGAINLRKHMVYEEEVPEMSDCPASTISAASGRSIIIRPAGLRSPIRH